MSKQFLKVADLTLQNGGYLSNKEGSPVGNAEFVQAQQHAEFIVIFAEKAKGKDFKGKQADSLAALRQEVQNFLSKDKKISFVDQPKEVKRPTTEKIKAEALDFINFQESTVKVDKINNFLQQFKVIQEFEKFGLFFEEEIVKLNKIYSIKEIVAAVTEVIDLLD